MTAIQVVLITLVCLVAWAAAVRALERRSTRDGELLAGALVLFLTVYARVFHRLRTTGREHAPRGRRPGPLIVVANHTAGVDPLLIQAVCEFEPRWIMARDMRIPALGPLWRYLRIVFVDRRDRGSLAFREAVEHVKGGGVIGVFPEGGIERPAQTILPFQAGVGLLIARTGAPVLPFIIEGAPRDAVRAWDSLYKRGRVRLRVMPPIDYASTGLRPAQIAEDLRGRYLEWTGWPANDAAPSAAEGPK